MAAWWIVLAVAAPSPQPANTQAALGRLHSCAALTADAERLTCYDREAVALDHAVADGSIVLVSPAQIESERRAAFGYNQPDPRIARSAHRAAVPEVKQLESTVRIVRFASYGRYDLQLANGSVWQNVDLLTNTPSPGDKVSISKTPFGSYLMKVPFAGAVHAKRLK